MITNTLKLCAWNIHGYYSRLIGNKFEDKEFIKIFDDVDVIGITETHMHEEASDGMNIPGFHRLKFKNELKNKRSNTAPKGIAVFVKEDKKKLFSPVMMDNEDAIWIKMKKEISGEAQDIFIGTCYLNPSRGQKNDQKIAKLAEDIAELQEKGMVIIQGDLNARTGGLEDTVAPDKSDEIFEINFDKPPPKRNSQDEKVDSRGQELLDMCKSLDINIVNGRRTGDPFGEYTCIKYNGNSVVDYVIASPTVYDKVSLFKVGEFLPWLSDHCPLYCTLEVSKGCTSTGKECKKSKAPKRYVWSEESKAKYLELISTAEFLGKWDKIDQIDHSDPNLAVNYVSEVLVEAADKMKAKFVKEHDNQDPPWFDSSCKELKDSIRDLGKMIRKNPRYDNLKKKLSVRKKELKRRVRENKTKYKNDLMSQMQQSRKDSKKFWRLLDKMEKRSDDTVFKQGISNQRWTSHFKTIFNKPDCNTPFPPNTSAAGALDGDISTEEILLAAYILRNGKCPGFDSVSNEMLQCLLKARPDILKKVFNAILSRPHTIQKWSISMINPLHKAGSKMDPDNYRGISLLSCFSKFFSAILNMRLTEYALDTNIFSKSQLGFLAGCRTADALLILNNLIEYYCKKKSQFMYGCFVDFKKAFDSIPRHVLFQKLLDYNITGKFYDCLVNIYINDVACIKVGEHVTPAFLANQGVKQGCILSPTLFNIFLADFQPFVETAQCHPVVLRGNLKIGCLIWADDIVLLSQSKKGLQTMLQALHLYEEKWYGTEYQKDKNNGL